MAIVEKKLKETFGYELVPIKQNNNGEKKKVLIKSWILRLEQFGDNEETEIYLNSLRTREEKEKLALITTIVSFILTNNLHLEEGF
jgi:hypothetical protein